MVPKADSGAFLLLFLLVLTVTEPLRPGARRAGAGRAAGGGAGGLQGWGRLGPSSNPPDRVLGGHRRRAACRPPCPPPGTVALQDRAVSLPGLERLVHHGTLFSRDVAFG